MDQGIKVVIGADVANAVNGINTVNQTIGHVSSGSQTAKFAVLDLGHVIRDLPYAISNPALLTGPFDKTFQLFTSLRQESGSLKGALASIGGVLSGPAGILIGFELLTTAAALFFGRTSDHAKKTKADVEEFDKTLKDAAESVGKEASQVTTLFNALNSGTLNPRQRQQALKELQGINAEFFGSLKEEKGTIEGLSLAYDNYLIRLNDIGRAKAIESQITKLFDKKIELELKLDPKFLAATDEGVQKQIGELKKHLELLGGELSPEEFKKLTSRTGTDIFQAQSQDKAIAALEKRAKIEGQIQDLEKGHAFFQDKTFLAAKKQIDQIDLQIKGLSDLQIKTGNFEIKQDPLKKERKKVEKEFSDLVLKPSIVFSVKQNEQTERINEIISGTFKENQITAPNLIPEDFGRGVVKQIEDFGKAKKELFQIQQIAKETQSILVDTLGGAFTDLFDTIVSGGQNALQAFGQAIAGVIKRLIAAAITAALFAAIIGAATGGSSFGGGATKFAGGFQNLFSQLGGFKFADGGIVNRPTFGLFGEAGPEAVIPLDRLPKIINQAAGNTNVNITGEFAIRGRELVAFFNREQAAFKRVN